MPNHQFHQQMKILQERAKDISPSNSKSNASIQGICYSMNTKFCVSGKKKQMDFDRENSSQDESKADMKSKKAI